MVFWFLYFCLKRSELQTTRTHRSLRCLACQKGSETTCTGDTFGTGQRDRHCDDSDIITQKLVHYN